MWTRRSSEPMPNGAEKEGDGGYLASASDLMIGLLFVFIILVVVLALEQRRQQQAFDERSSKLMGAGDPLIVVTNAIGDALKKAVPNVQIDPETGVISLPEDALFERGKAQLSDSGRKKLAEAGEQLASAMPCYVHNKRDGLNCSLNPYGHEVETVFIEGHTDSVPYARGGRDNFDLSLARAKAVDEVMMLNRPLSEFRNKAKQPLFSFSAYADTRPLPGTESTDGRNRRVDLRIVLSYKPIGELIPELRAAAKGSARP